METSHSEHAALAVEVRESRLFARIHNLSDGVFTVAMTLLMLNFRIPANLPGEEIPQILSSLSPELFAYFLSFAALGAFWIGDYNHFRWIQRADRPFLWITILFLSLIALIPASTAVLERYYNLQVVVVAYGIHLILAASALLWQWDYAAHHKRLVAEDTTPEVSLRMKNRIRVPILLNAVGIALSFISPYLTLFIFAVVLALAIIPVSSDKIYDTFDGKLFGRS